ncbi:MAG TPA: hypothetical protein VEB67_01930 [Nitrososphaerales archaeon]|nr:hypothetical protein [Nitrososphaerales archaeon]
MVARGMFLGVVALLAALLLVSATLAAIYYQDYQQQVSQNQKEGEELDRALASYATVQGSLNSSLKDYNTTLSLLADSVANLNTSTPSYLRASGALATLWAEYRSLAKEQGMKAVSLAVNVLVDFGNGTRRWYNDSAAQAGWNAYVTTLVLLDGHLDAVWYPQYGEHFVTGVAGVNQTTTTSWFVWVKGAGGWAVAGSGADGVQMDNGTSIAWTLCDYDASFNPQCSP